MPHHAPQWNDNNTLSTVNAAVLHNLVDSGPLASHVAPHGGPVNGMKLVENDPIPGAKWFMIAGLKH